MVRAGQHQAKNDYMMLSRAGIVRFHAAFVGGRSLNGHFDFYEVSDFT